MVIILDFNDSFTWNIARYFHHEDIPVTVWKFPRDYSTSQESLSLMLKQYSRIVLVWGPGPGHPDDYPEERKLLAWAMMQKKIFNLGICLGHQMLGLYFSYQLHYLKSPMHGRRWSIKLHRPGFFINKSVSQIWVQSYNSMGLIGPVASNSSNVRGRPRPTALLLVQNRIEGMRWERGVSYQFHPESVGTTCPELFFGPTREFLYNRRDGLSD